MFDKSEVLARIWGSAQAPLLEKELRGAHVVGE